MYKFLLAFSVSFVFSLSFGQDILPSKKPVSVDYVQENLNEKNLQFHFIDVGGGLAAFVKTASGKTIFIDGGKGSGSKVAEYASEFMGEDKVIDLAIVTHADSDHFRGMVSIFKEFEVKEFWYNGYVSPKLNYELSQWAEFVLLVKKEKCETKWVLGDKYELGEKVVFDKGESDSDDDDVSLTLLNLDPNPPSKDPDNGRSFSESLRRNDASIVFKLEYGATSFLITGDINGREKGASKNSCDSKEKELIDRAKEQKGNFLLNATVLQIPHHGSDGSSSMPFLKAVAPSYIIVPAGTAHGHPHSPTMKRLKKVVKSKFILRTDEGDDGSKDSKEPKFDDNIIFSVSQEKIEYVYRMKF